MFQRYSRYLICIFKTQNIFGTTSISQLTKREGLQISQLNIASREKSRVVEIRLKPVFHWTEFSTRSRIFLCLVSYQAELN